MTQPILVTGGTGTLGRAVVRRLIDAGSDVRVLSRRPPEDGPRGLEWVTGALSTGAGIGQAVRGVAEIIHCAIDVREWLATKVFVGYVRGVGDVDEH